MSDPFRRLPDRPRLLVSVRDAEEAEEALAADVSDVKEPANGPLGAASPEVWRSVLDRVAGRRPVTLALGEVRDWGRDVPAVPRGVAGVKLGLDGATAADWLALRHRFEDAAGRPLPWVAVAYADRPGAADVFAAAVETGCVAVLVDTADKTGPPLPALSFTPPRTPLPLAVAGRLRVEDFAAFANADVIGVRSAACGGDRGDAVRREHVARCTAALSTRPATTPPTAASSDPVPESRPAASARRSSASAAR